LTSLDDGVHWEMPIEQDPRGVSWMTGVDAGNRGRLRAATVEEIKRTARRLLAEEGLQSVTLRAIARRMGVTAPGLYRYFPSYEDLLSTLVCDIYDELSDALQAERRTDPGAAPVQRLLRMIRRFRLWAVEHPCEFALVFSTPLPGPRDDLGQSPARACAPVLPERARLRSTKASGALPRRTPPTSRTGGQRFGRVFAEVFLDLWEQQPFEIPEDADLPTHLLEQLARYRQIMVEEGQRVLDDDARGLVAAAELPLGALYLFVRAWAALFGVVTMEVFGHLHFCLDDASSFFEAELRDIARMLGTEDPEDPFVS
jgi:AcrR family transcriptional regulator